ncbi:VOC family protein [Tomitella biformata]|uniref:VOC family protein n=1 Tax=Tomitella biformata TaxID=630403 RepID=UPI00046378AE|nr:VOC family protein [Tomitella biformata]
MTKRLNPYLIFRDGAREAMTFYQSVFGGELEISTFESMQASEDPAEAQKVMHSMLDIGGGLTLMGADTPNSMEFSPRANAPISLSGDEEPLLRSWWEGLSDGGEITMPLNKAPWGDYFGMCVDKYGVEWMIDIGTAD